MHIHCFSRDNDFADQALGNGLSFFKRELRQMRPQPLAKGRGMINHLLPLDALLSCVGQQPIFLFNLLQRSRKFLPPRLALTACDHLGLISLQQALVLPRNPLPPLPPWRLLRLKP